MHHANWMILFVNSRAKVALFVAITFFSLKPTLLFAGDWAVYYHSQLPPEAFDHYSLVILDSTAHPDISPMLERGKTVLGYISLGEVADYRYWYSDVSAEGLLLKENKSWPGSYMVDLRDPRWTKRVIEQLIPDILRQGFSGVFIDTLDNAAELERIDPKKYAGMALAATNLIKTIRRHYPEIKIMLNRGYDLLPEVGGEIDIVLGESVFSTYSHKLKAYHLVEKNLYAQQLKILLDAKQKYSGLEVYTLDYWDPKDSKGIEHIYRTERTNGFVPYVSTIGLDRLIPEPRTIMN